MQQEGENLYYIIQKTINTEKEEKSNHYQNEEISIYYDFFGFI